MRVRRTFTGTSATRNYVQTPASSADLKTEPAGGAKAELMAESKFERHRQPWRTDEIQKLHQLAGKGVALRAIAKALTRSEESVRDRAKLDKLKIAKLH